jgi:hypothetical protein
VKNDCSGADATPTRGDSCEGNSDRQHIQEIRGVDHMHVSGHAGPLACKNDLNPVHHPEASILRHPEIGVGRVSAAVGQFQSATMRPVLIPEDRDVLLGAARANVRPGMPEPTRLDEA